MKKSIIIVAVILLVSFAAIIGITKFNKKDVIKNETKQSETSKELDNNTVPADSEPDDVDKNDNDEKDEVGTISNKENIDSTSTGNVTNSGGNTNNNSNVSNSSNSITTDEKQNTQIAENSSEGVNTNSCTPKKFDASFVRADFTSMAKCTEVGDKYKAIGYGYFCDFYPDDCGDTYYMLTLYERNTGVEFDYHDVELPN